MDESFRKFADGLHPKFEALISMAPITDGKLPKEMPKAGVYLYTEHGRHLYVGRTRNLRGRYGQHSRPSAKHNDAPFAFKLARIATNNLNPDYKAGPLSRASLSANEVFTAAFRLALSRIRNMEYRYVDEADPVAQCLLEVYCSVVLHTPHNDFATT